MELPYRVGDKRLLLPFVIKNHTNYSNIEYRIIENQMYNVHYFLKLCKGLLYSAIILRREQKFFYSKKVNASCTRRYYKS